MPTLSFEEAYREWRNRARKYTAASIVSKAFDALGHVDVNSVEGLRHAPWNLLLIVKWIFQDRSMTSRTPIGDQAFWELRQALWKFPERTTLTTDGSSYLLFRLLTNPQMGFQRRLTRGFIRDAALLNAMQPNSVVRRHFTAKTGLEPSEFIDFGYALFAQIEKSGSRHVDTGYFGPLAKAYGSQKIRRFLANISATPDELTDFFRSLPDSSKKVVSEYFEFPAIKRYPLLNINGTLQYWHKSVVYRCLEDYVHMVLSGDEAVVRKFTSAFESHVVSESVRLGSRFHGETELKGWLPHGSKVPDGLLAFDDANVFIESKAGAYGEGFMTLGSQAILRDRTAAIVKAIEQGRAAASGLRAKGSAPASITGKDTDYLLVVTNRELALGSGAKLTAMFPEGRKLQSAPGNTLPLERIYFLSIDDYERMVSACVSDPTVQLPSLLESFVRADSDPRAAVFFFNQHLDEAQVGRSTSPLLVEAEEEVLKRLQAIVPGLDD